MKKFTIPGRLDGLNTIINKNRHNKYAGAKLSKKNIKKVSWSIKAAKLKKLKEPVILSIIYYEKNRRRDPDNILTSKKFILDAMQRTGLIQNDGWKNIESIEEYWQVDKENPRIEVTIYENIK